MHVIGAVCTPSSPTSLYRTPPSDKALSDKALSDASSDDDDAIARSNDESSCRTRFAFAAGTGSVVCTSTAPDARPMNSSAPPRATWHRVTARSLGDIPALIPGRAVAICVRRPPPSTATRTPPPPPPSAAATTCRVAAPLPFPRKTSLPPDIGHALPHRLRFAASPSSGFAAGERPTKASAAIAMDGIDVGSILGRSSSASVVGSDDARGSRPPRVPSSRGSTTSTTRARGRVAAARVARRRALWRGGLRRPMRVVVVVVGALVFSHRFVPSAPRSPPSTLADRLHPRPRFDRWRSRPGSTS